MKFFKNIIFICLPLLFISCSQKSVFSFVEKENTLVFAQNKIVNTHVKLTNPTYTHTFNSCIISSYTISDKNSLYGKLFIENIALNSNCSWTGLPTSFFKQSFKYTLKLSRIETIEDIDIGSFNFKTLLIDEKSYMNLIYIFSTTQETIIADYEGKLSNKLLKELKADYENKSLLKPRYISNYSKSLVDSNILNDYFVKERPD